MQRTALVTGASRGIGLAIATRLASDGWDIVNMDERSSFVTGQTLYVCGGISLARGGN